MENWTFRFLFGCDGGDDTSRLKACLHFVQTSTDIQAGITIFSKIDSILGALKKSSTKNKNKKSNKKDRKKKEKEDDDFLEKEQAKVREEKQVLDNAARFGRAMGCNSLVRCLGKIGNKIRYKAGVSALREHSEAVTLIKVVLARMLLEWTNTARLRLGTHSDSTCALAWNIEEDKGWWRKSNGRSGPIPSIDLCGCTSLCVWKLSGTACPGHIAFKIGCLHGLFINTFTLSRYNG